MSSLLLIVRHQVLAMVKSGSVLLVSGLLICFSLAASRLLVTDFEKRSKDYDRVLAEREHDAAEAEAIAQRGARHPDVSQRRAAELRFAVAERRAALSLGARLTGWDVIVYGVTGRLSRLADITDWRGYELLAPTSSYLPTVFSAVDFSFLVTGVLGLICVIGGSMAMATEREEGTLPLLLSQPVPRPAIVLGKVLSIYLLAAVLCGLCLCSYLVPIASSDVLPFDWRAGSLLSLYGTSVAYGGAMGAWGVAIAARAAIVRSALVSVIFWVMSVYCWQIISGEVASLLVEGPEEDNYMKESREIYGDSYGHGRRWEVIGLTNRLDAERHRRVLTWQRTAALFARLSPAGATGLALERTCGTGYERAMAFAFELLHTQAEMAAHYSDLPTEETYSGSQLSTSTGVGGGGQEDQSSPLWSISSILLSSLGAGALGVARFSRA